MQDNRARAVLSPDTHLCDDAYRIIDTVGKGGFGITYKAVDLETQRHVAIKECFPISELIQRRGNTIISFEEPDDFLKKCVRWLWDEAEMLARFDDPSIVRIRRCFPENGTAYVVLDFIEGETLGRRIERLRDDGKTMGEEELRGIVHDIAGGLSLVHDNGFYHRDISPQNIILRPEGTPVLIDFGSARHQLQELQEGLSAVFNPTYAPPEQYLDRGRPTRKNTEIGRANLAGSIRQSARTDIFALSGTLYHAVTGEEPDSNERFNNMINTREDSLNLRARVQPGAYSESLLAAIERGLALRAEDRPRDIREFYALINGRELKVPSTESADTAQDKPISLNGGTMPDAYPEIGSGRDAVTGAQLESGANTASGVEVLEPDVRRPRWRIIARVKEWLKAVAEDRAPLSLGTTSGTAEFTLELNDPVVGMSIDAGGEGIAAISAGEIAVRALRKGMRETRLDYDGESITAVLLVSPTADVIVGDQAGFVTAFDIRNKKHGLHFKAGDAAITCIRASPDRKLLVTATRDGQLMGWTVPALKSVTLGWLPNPIAALIFPDPATIVAVDESGEVLRRIWGNPKETRFQLQADIREGTIALAPSGRLALAALQGGGQLGKFSLANGNLISTLDAPHAPVTCAAVLGTGLAATGAGSGVVTLWDPAKMLELKNLADHQGRVRSLAFTPRKRILASAGDDGKVHIYEIANL